MRLAIWCAVAILLCQGQEPSQRLSGTIRIWGDRYMSAVAKYWAEGFRKHHPGVEFEIKLMGTDTAVPSIYSGVADLGLMGREGNTTDNTSFVHLLNYDPLRLQLMTGSLNVPGKSYALAVFVHKDNPVSKLTLAQLDAAFGCEHLRGLDNIRTWGQLGLTGEWKDKPIHLYGFDTETGTGVFFLHEVLKDSRKMNWENLREFKDIQNPDGSVYEAGQQIIDALRDDPYGLAISSVLYAHPQVKAVALASAQGGTYYQATKENLISRKYSLTRSTYVVVNRPPGQPLDPKVKEFLRYVWSKEGQADVLRDGGYLPLNDEAIREQLKKLE